MPGFKLITSNRLEKLIDELAGLLSSITPKSPFVSEIIVVQNQGMARWIALELATRHGICANYEFAFPNTLIENISVKLWGNLTEPAPNNQETMAWRIMKRLGQLKANPEFGAIRNYLQRDDNQLKLYQLSVRIADLFDQYTIYRPEMILDWNTHHIDHWQAILWEALAENNTDIDRATLFQRLFEKIQNREINVENLPERISFFGISALPPVYLKLFEALSDLCEINLLVMNPCREYWADILSYKESERITRKSGKRNIDQSMLHIEKGNSLLASMGATGRDFFELLAEHDEVPLFENPGEYNLLTAIQTDILNLQDRGNGKIPRMEINFDDNSLQIHSCHSPVREIETLYDNLLNMFNSDPHLNPRDIIVMTPDIETYAPYVQAVFDSAEDDTKRIPFTIADRCWRTESSVVNTLSDILNLGGGRFEVSKVMVILESPAIYQKFLLNPAEIELIARWVKEVNIRWGWDGSFKADFGLPEYEENTWRFGLNRLFLGYALPGGDTLYKGIAPYNHIEGELAITLGKFAEFINCLFGHIQLLNQAATLTTWADNLSALCQTMFIANDDTDRELQLLYRAFAELRNIESDIIFDSAVSLEIIKQYLKDRFSSHGFGFGFLAGAVTFCAMLPMRSIPFKVICLIGLNNDSYPRQATPLSFDLIAAHPRPGDRSIRNTDRYLFLEALLSARQCLYISHIGQNIQDNSLIPPSVLVSELLDYIKQGFYSEADDIEKAITTKHRLQAFSPHYFENDRKLFSFSQGNYLAAQSLFNGNKQTPQFFYGELPESKELNKTVDLQSLSGFFANPVKYLCNKRLNLYLDDSDHSFEDDEPFTITGLDKYKTESGLLERYLSGREGINNYDNLKALGVLPHGAIGKAAYKAIAENIKQLAKTVETHVGGGQLPPYELSLTFGDISLTGTIDNIYQAGRVQYRAATLKAKDLLSAWIYHLTLNCITDTIYPKTSIIISTDTENPIVKFTPVHNASELISDLIKLYGLGLTKPLYFFPETSLKYAEQIMAGNSLVYARHSAGGIWVGGNNSRGEGEDCYFKLCCEQISPFNDDFRQLAMAIYQPLLEHWDVSK